MVPLTTNTARRAICLAVDASNIRVGGGVTHLIELLREADPTSHGFERIIVWACAPTLARLKHRPSLEERSDPALDAHLLKRIAWPRRPLPKLLREAKADFLLVPSVSTSPRLP